MISTFLIALSLRVVLLALPVTVALLAFRRVLLSETANAWLYGASMLYAVVTAVGVLPWALGLASPHGLFLSFSALSPLVWLGVAMVCDRDRLNRYDNNDLGHAAPEPLILTNPQLPPVPMFRHSKPEGLVNTRATYGNPDERTVTPPKKAHARDSAARGVIAVARAMRGRLGENEIDPIASRSSHQEGDLDRLSFLNRSPG